MRSILGATIDDEADVTIVDMEAGLEHLSRSGGTLAYADVLLAIMEPTRKSIITAVRTKALAEELGIPRTYGLGNKAHLPEDREFYVDVCGEYGLPLAGVIPYDTGVVHADRSGTIMESGEGGPVRAEIATVLEFLDAISVS